jgi:hypothetical protein
VIREPGMAVDANTAGSDASFDRAAPVKGLPAMNKLVENVARRFKEAACGCTSEHQADWEMTVRDPEGDEKIQIGPAGPGEQVAVAPPGWEDTVKKMKKHKDKIDNPWALAWYMKNKGAEPHKEGSSLKAVLAAQEEMHEEQKQQQQQAQMQQEAVAPPGWEDTVKKMKKHKEIDNPWALAWYMKNKGAEPHHASTPTYVLAANEAFKRHQARAKNAGK